MSWLFLRVGGTAAILLTCASAAADGPEPGAEQGGPRGPADGLVVETGAGYSGGLFTAIKGHDPRVAHGAAFHLAAGWAWPVKATQSLGAQLFMDGAYDADTIVGANSTGKVAPRYGVAGALYGDVAHLRLGGAWATSRYQGGEYSGPSVVFAAGWHFALLPSLQTSRRPWYFVHPQLTFEFVPSFDFLKVGDETLHRWTLAAMLGFAGY